MDITDVEKHILRKMYLEKRIGGKHTDIENLKKGVPKHARGDIEKAVKSLIRKGLIIRKPTSYGMHVSLNAKMIDEIKSILEDKHIF